MQSFHEFISEGGYNVPVVSISKDEVDLKKSATINEINRNLAAELSLNFMNPYGGWVKARKVLEMYHIYLPKVIFQDSEEGEEVVAISQFGNTFGADLSGTVTSPNMTENGEFYFYYSYGIGSSGFYETFAVVTDEEGLNDLLADDDEIDDFDDSEDEDDSQ